IRTKCGQRAPPRGKTGRAGRAASWIERAAVNVRSPFERSAPRRDAGRQSADRGKTRHEMQPRRNQNTAEPGNPTVVTAEAVSRPELPDHRPGWRQVMIATRPTAGPEDRTPRSSQFATGVAYRLMVPLGTARD